MGHHRPEAPHRGGRNADAPLRQVSLQERVDEGASPTDRRLLVLSQQRVWEAAAPPKLFDPLGADLVEREPAHADVLDAARQALGALPEQVAGGAAEDEEPRGERTPDSQNTEDR